MRIKRLTAFQSDPGASRRLAAGPLFGCGFGQGHFGEVFQGAAAFRGAHRITQSIWRLRYPLQRAFHEYALPLGATRVLVDLPCPALQSRIVVQLSPAPARTFSHSCSDLLKTVRAIEITLDLLGIDGCEVHVSHFSNIPCGKGNGSSSADAVAGIRAVVSACKTRLADQVLGQILCIAEGAANPAHLSRPVLFAHRDGWIMHEFNARWPEFLALGIEFDGTLLTDALIPARYDVNDLREQAILIRSLARGFAFGDIAEIARVSSRIATWDSRLPYDHHWISGLVKDYGAAGYAVAHSGVVAALLWPPGERARRAREAAERDLAMEGRRTRTWEC